MADVKNIDSVLMKDMADKAAGVDNSAAYIPEMSHDEVKVEEPVKEESVKEESESLPEIGQEESTSSEQSSENEKSREKSSEKSKDSPIDEYGNPIEKPRLYTEEELQQRIRDRLSRGKHSEPQYQPDNQYQQPQQYQPNQQQVQQAQDSGFQHNPESEQSWEDQLSQFIDNRLEQRQTKAAEQQWRQQEAAKQAEFESKFSSGMGKYQDFHQVVAGKPITDTMMMATRSLENPAAFVYAASKLHPQEIERISRISDPYAQASEVGRLHEKMVKERRMVSAAAKPIEPVKSDMPSKSYHTSPIDQRIAQHAKSKVR